MKRAHVALLAKTACMASHSAAHALYERVFLATALCLPTLVLPSSASPYGSPSCRW